MHTNEQNWIRKKIIKFKIRTGVKTNVSLSRMSYKDSQSLKIKRDYARKIQRSNKVI